MFYTMLYHVVLYYIIHPFVFSAPLMRKNLADQLGMTGRCSLAKAPSVEILKSWVGIGGVPVSVPPYPCPFWHVSYDFVT